MFIIYVIDLSTKIKCKDGRSHFYKNQKYKPLEVEIFFKVISFQKFLIVLYVFFLEKCSTFRRSIPLSNYTQDPLLKKLKYFEISALKVA